MTTAVGSAFKISARDGRARAGVLITAHGPVETPVFMPVATQGAIKAMSQADLEELGVRAILANAYHLYLRPGTELMRKAGGLHRFMNYPGAILTDSGGFQVMSLSQLCTMSEEGATFKSYLDGSMHTFTPENVIDIQEKIGSDMWTSLDECIKYPVEESRARQALELTMRWTERASRQYQSKLAARADLPPETRPLFFPIIQGSLFPELRRTAAEHIAAIPHDGVSLGGFSVGEPKPTTIEVLGRTLEHVGADKPRYLMGVGTPEELWNAVELGVDMFDCVWPTRVARHGGAMVHTGRLNLLSAASREDFRPLDPDCSCKVCKVHTRAYLAHLYRANELTVGSLVSYHNVHFLVSMMRRIRASILEGRFAAARKEFFEKHTS